MVWSPHLRVAFAGLVLLASSSSTTFAQNAVEAQQLPTLELHKLRSFTDIYYWHQKDSRPNHGRTDSVVQPQLSFEYRFAPSVALTFGGNYTSISGSKFDPVGTYKSDGVTGFIGATYFFTNDFTLNVTGGALRSWVYETRPAGTGGVASGEKTNNGGFISANLNAAYNIDNFRITPFANVLFYSGEESAGLETDGFFRAANPDSLGRMTLGSEIFYRMSMPTYTIEPMLRAAFLYDYNLLNDTYDRTAFELATGFNVPINGSLTAALRAITTLGRDDYQMWGVRGSLYYNF